MIRTLRRPGQDEPALTPAILALHYEYNRTWPRGGFRSRFWARPEVPHKLRTEPDPRKVLDGEAQRLEHEHEYTEWREARLAWLREQARV